MSIKHEKQMLQQLVKAREAVKRKYNKSKYGKEEVEIVLSQTIKPLIDPLQEIVQVTKEAKIFVPEKIKT